MNGKIGFATLALVSALLLPACAEDVPGIYIRGNRVIDSDDCQAAPALATSGATRVSGVLDTYIANRYFLTLAYENTLVPANSYGFESGGGDGLEASPWEPNRVNLTKIEVSIDGPPGLGVPLPKVEHRISGDVEPLSTGILLFNVLEGDDIERIRQSPLLQQNGYVDLQLRIRIEGRTVAGRKIGSNEFSYPLRVCVGCGVNFPPESLDTTAVRQPNCRNIEGYTPTGLEQCYAGQDDATDCRLVCPGLVASDRDTLGLCEPAF